MPTGYTCYIEDGKITEGKDFLLKCARGFGACISMRDESLAVDIPVKFEPDTYHKEQLEKAYEDLEKYKAMTIEEAQKLVDAAYEKNQKYYTDALIKNREMNARYIKIREEISNWTPPTPEHENLKKFALEQIDMSTEYTKDDFYMKELEREKSTPEEYISMGLEGATKDIEYHLKGWNDAVQVAEERTKWVNDLRESLK